ncbi:MAG: zinc ABC transporter substrate-binding protein [Rhodocyclaceae bacterium]|nr:zinc ABC transporter substrate-binding protein [Rhodocyclaceae bacterium]
MPKRIWAALLAGLLAAPALRAAPAALACEPEWGALVAAIGGERVSLKVATTARQDPHRVEARPSLLAAARRADLLVCTGADLEAGWLPVLLRRAGNPRIQPGQPGHLMAADHVTLLERPTRLDRADGDIHPGGNPHIHTDPRNVARVAAALTERLVRIDPEGEAGYRERFARFSADWDAALDRWRARAAPLAGVEVVVSHKAFPYLQAWLGLVEVAALEERPGVAPGPAHLQAVLQAIESRPVRMILSTPIDDPDAGRWLSERTGLPLVRLPYTVGGSPAARDLITLFDATLDRLLEALE